MIDRWLGQLRTRGEVALVWLVGHISAFWPFALFGVVLALSWSGLRQIHPGQVRGALRSLDRTWLLAAGVATVVNVAVMGLYDVVAFRRTRAGWLTRWHHGGVAFAWSNFLTLGPVAGPAVRFWLYREEVDDPSELHAGIASVATAFSSGLIGWTLTALLASRIDAPPIVFGLVSFGLVMACVVVARAIARRTKAFDAPATAWPRLFELAAIGWLDWILAAAVFLACLKAGSAPGPPVEYVKLFFLGQALGLASLVPGGIGSSDAFWIAKLPAAQSATAAILLAYRVIYYVVPWAVASCVLLARATRHAPRRLELARRVVAGLVGGGGVLIVLSSASPALHARLMILERIVPLPLVEVGQVAAALTGLVLIVLARGLARGYRAAFRATLMLLTLAAFAAIAKGLDWEEAIVLGAIAVAARSQAALFDRPSRGDWIEAPDLVLAFAALTLFLTFGIFSHRVSARTLERWSHIGYRMEATRFVRTAASMALAVAAGTLYVLVRPAVGFERLDDDAIDRTLERHARIGSGTNMLMVATGDKAVFSAAHGLCAYRTIGPYLVIFANPDVEADHDRAPFLDELFTFAAECDRRPVFYQISLDWIPLLHDRGYHLFKLGEEALVPLDRVSLDGHAGKMYRQILRRGERDGVRFRILEPAEIARRIGELAEISAEWLEDRKLVERQFSLGFFDPAYITRFPCAVVEESHSARRILAFANLLQGPRYEELSVDLMRQRNTGPQVMDFLVVSLLLEGKRAGYHAFNLGMAPLSSVGAARGAHVRERLARILFQRGEQWYNFQGLRFYKEKFDPDWAPRYLAYQNAWEWPVVLAHASALIAGGWTNILRPPHDSPAADDRASAASPASAGEAAGT